tara:strand:- start:368 stop:1378 length:1011 start_codon:yes stop_codon:yes gene_type:complete
MAQLSFVTGSTFFAFDENASKADRFAASIKGLKGGQSVQARLNGAGVAVDRMSAATSTGLGAKVQALSAAAANSAEGVSLLQTAEAALSDIETKLERMVTLAADAKSESRSEFERAQYDSEFQTLISEIDAIAADTEFNGTKILQGNGNGGNTLEINFKVGTGNDTGDEVTVSINAASVSALSSTLAVADIQSVSNATTARTAVATAQAALAEIQGAVTGKFQSFASAAENNASVAGHHEQARAAQVAPTVVIDLAQVTAGRITDENGVDLDGGDIATMRKLVLDLNNSFVKTAIDRPASANDGSDSGSNRAATTQSNSGGSGNSESSNDGDQDAA